LPSRSTISSAKFFADPEAYVLPTAAKVPGLDGEKMSKSYNNHIEIFETPKEMRKR
jgi:tryptophanyl-tRNA synthetase